jgi:hypothetical protein
MRLFMDSICARRASALLFAYLVAFGTVAGTASTVRADNQLDYSVRGLLVSFSRNLERGDQWIGGLDPGVSHKLAQWAREADIVDGRQAWKIVALEQGITARIKADRALVEHPAFREEVIQQFSALLTPEQLRKFDAVQAEHHTLKVTLDHLSKVAPATRRYAVAHDDALPADLGALAELDIAPATFLAGASDVKIPADYGTWEIARKAEWINKNTDFEYLAAGQKEHKMPEGFVIAHLKHAATLRDYLFAQSPDSLRFADAETYTTAVTELKEGKNPPPSLK